VQNLPLFVRLSGRPFILIGEGAAVAAKRKLLERAGAKIVGEESNAALAIVAVDDEVEAETIVARLRARGILVNAVDRPALCDFTLPAIVDRDPVLIAIGTGGASAGLAKALRQRLEILIPQRLSQLATAMKAARPALKQRWPDSADRRRAIDGAFEPGGPLDPLAENSADQVNNWAAANTAFTPSQHITGLHPIILTSDDPDDLTLRQARLLAQADIVFHRANVAAAIINRARADAERVPCDRAPDGPFTGFTLYLERA
jgi:uroporphyrin-III C-methyltransferase / precorrin-2 dehydrogenase / sirohydrochlorin ferrochelatase